MADFSFEKAAGGRVAGVDEVGRGPLAGPVVAAAVILERRLLPRRLYQLDDSKALSRIEREEFCAILVEQAGRGSAIRIGIGAASVREIDGINILQASLLAMRRAVLALGEVPDHALVDGNKAPTLPCRVQTIVKGDSISLSIAAASIVAKVTRDRMMTSLAERYRGYGWATNAGYGTAEHHAGLRTHGVTRHHRRSFAPIRLALEGRLQQAEKVDTGPEPMRERLTSAFL